MNKMLQLLRSVVVILLVFLPLVAGECYNNVAPAERTDCGWPAIPKEKCESFSGCCFDSSVGGVIWCYYSKPGSNPCERNPCLNGGVCRGKGSEFTCDCEGYYSGKTCEIPNAQCKDVIPSKREDCGWAGITKQQCKDTGCCYDNTTQGVKWCFKKPAEPMYLSITADNVVDAVYLDGVAYITLPNNKNWEVVDRIAIPENTHVIAVKCSDNGVVAGLLASVTNDYILTDDHRWKCTNIAPAADWYDPAFNDDGWPQAVVAGLNNGDRYHGTVKQISSNAQWIWTHNYTVKPIQTPVYCRAYFNVDECAMHTDTCDQHASCTNTVWSYVCTCNAGYTGDGFHCSDINECLNPNTCDPNAVCENTDGSYVCTCSPRHLGNGTYCTDTFEMYTKTGEAINLYVTGDTSSQLQHSSRPATKFKLVPCQFLSSVSASKQPSCVSLTPLSNPTWYVRHRNYWLYAETGAGDLYRSDASFTLEKDTFAADYVAFHSIFQNSNFYISIVGGSAQLKIVNSGGASGNEDLASFNVVLF